MSMEKPKTALTWPLVTALSLVVAGAAIVWALTVSIQAADAQKRMIEVEAAREAAAKQISALRDELGAKKAKIEELSKRTAVMEDDLAALQEQASTLEAASSPEAEAFAANIEALLAPEEETPAGASGGNPFRDMFEGEQGDAMVEMSGNMRVSLFYNEFLGSAGLTDDAKKQVRELLAAYEKENVRIGMTTPEGMGQEELAGHFEALSTNLRRDLAELLTPEQLAQFEEHDATKASGLLEMTLGGQANMLAPDMSSETREMTVNTMVDELMATGIDFSLPGSGITREGNTAQREAILNAQQRLAAALPPEEMEEVDNLVRQFLAALKAQESWAEPQTQRAAP